MLASLLKRIDSFSWCASKLADISVVVLVLAMIYEVIARYFFLAPTEWAFDISYMCSGALFIAGVAWTLKENAHIRITVFQQKLPAKLNAVIECFFFGFILTPLFTFIFWVSLNKSWIAFIENEVESVSPWAPKMWPFYTIISIGLAALTLQLFAQAIRAIGDYSRASNESMPSTTKCGD